MIRVRSERLRLPEEEVAYKKGGRVKGKKKAKKPKKPTAKRRRATGKRSRGEALKYMPLGGALPTTGMSSTVFGAPQAPSYFRAVQPDQTYANIPDVLKGLVSSQEKLFKEITARKQQEQADKAYAKKVVEEERTSTPTPSSTPTVGFRPLQSMFPNTLDILRSPVSTPSPPPIVTPVPRRALPSSYEGPLSSAEAGEPYYGADESLPLQPVASGEQMVPSAASHAASSSSSYHALDAQAPESVDDALERSSGIAGDIGLPPIEQPPSQKKGMPVPLQPGRTYKKPVVESESKEQAVLPPAPLVKKPSLPMIRLTADNVDQHIGRKVHFVSGGKPVTATIVSATASGITISGAPPEVAASTKNNLSWSRALQVVAR